MRRLAPTLISLSFVAAIACSSSSGDGEGDGESTGTTSTTTAGDGDGDETAGDETDGCMGQEPLPPLPCDQECNWPCGCEECEPNNVKCVEYDDAVMNQCGPDGTCADDIPCEEGRTCIPLTMTEGKCSELLACDEVQNLYDININKTSCADDDQCSVLDGHCEIGLGECWYAVNPQVTTELLEELAMQWMAESCGVDTCGGDCGAMPTAKCIDNVCTLE